MKETYNSNSHAIYTKALETAAEEVAFYQSKLEKSKELFSICERLLAGITDIKSLKTGMSDKKILRSSREALNKRIINAIKGIGWFSISKVAAENGLSYSQLCSWVNYHKDQVESKLKEGHRIHKYYRLVSEAKKPREKVKAIPAVIKKAITGKYLPVKEIAETTGYSLANIKRWVANNPRELEVSLSTKVRPGWKVRTYKLKA